MVKVNPTQVRELVEQPVLLWLADNGRGSDVGRDGSRRRRNDSFSLSVFQGQKIMVKITNHVLYYDAHSPLSSFPLSAHSTPGKGTVLKPLEVGANQGMRGGDIGLKLVIDNQNKAWVWDTRHTR